MKTNKVNSAVSVNKEEKVTIITSTFTIPFMDWKDGFVEEAAMMNWDEVLQVFNKVIVKALEDRMASCMDMLSKNLFNVVYSNEHTIIYKKDDGKYHNFNHASYKVMEDAINMFTIGDIFNLELPHFDQIMKALVWVEDRKDVQGISFSNLISCVMELTISKAQER